MQSKSRMSVRRRCRLGAVAMAAAVTLVGNGAFAADVTWDTAPGTIGAGNGAVTGGTGAWNTTNGNWTVDLGLNNVAWTNGGNNTAVFGDTGGTVTLGTGITVGGLKFDITGYTVTGNTLTLGVSSTFNVAAGSATVSSIVAGTATETLAVTGPGTLNLTNTGNTFLGDIIVDGGTLRVDGSTLNRFGGAGAKAITLTNGGTLVNHTGTFNPSATSKSLVIGAGGGTIQADTQVQFDDAGQISGSGLLTKTGSGLLLLDNQNFSAFTSEIVINAGTLRADRNAGALGAATSNPITVATGATLDLQIDPNGTRPLSLSGTGISNGGALSNTDSTATGTVDGLTTFVTSTVGIGGAGNLVLAGGADGSSNTITLNKVGNGTLTVNGTGANFAGVTTINSTGGLRLNSATSLGADVAVTVTGTNSAYVQIGAASGGSSYSLPGDGILGGDAAFMNSLTPGGNLNAFPSTIAQTAAGVNQNIATTHSFATDASRYFGLAADIGADNVTVGPGSVWKGITNDKQSRRLSTGVITANGDFDLQSLGGNLTLGNGGTAGGVSISKTGPITVTVKGGVVQLDDTTPNYDSDITFQVASGATLQTIGSNALGTDTSAANNAKVIVTSNGILNPNGGSTISGNVTIQAGGILNIDDANNLTGIGTITQVAGSITRITNNGSTALGGAQSPGTVPGSIVRLAATPILLLDTKIDPGAIYQVFGATRAIGDINLNASGADTAVLTNDTASRTMNNATTTTVSTVTIGANGGTLAATTGTTLTIATITNNTTGGTVISGPGNTLTIGSTATLDGSAKAGVVDMSGPATSGIDVGEINIVAGSLQGLGGGMPLKVGNGTGLITVQSGATFDSRTGTLSNGLMNVLAGGTVRFRSANATDNTLGNAAVAGLQGAGDVFVGRTDTGTNRDVALTVGANNVSTIFSGHLQDGDATRNGQLVKTGTASLELARAAGNSYTLGTTINAGTLLVSNTSGSATGPGGVTVNANGALGGTGIISGAVTFVGGGDLIPGASAGTLTVGALSLVATSELKYELGLPGVVGSGVNDLTVVNGALTLDGELDITPLTGFDIGTYRLIDYTGALTDNGLVFGDVPSGFAGVIDTATPNQVNLVVSAVPEPAGLGLVGVALAGLLGRRRRSR